MVGGHGACLCFLCLCRRRSGRLAGCALALAGCCSASFCLCCSGCCRISRLAGCIRTLVGGCRACLCCFCFSSRCCGRLCCFLRLFRRLFQCRIGFRYGCLCLPLPFGLIVYPSLFIGSALFFCFLSIAFIGIQRFHFLSNSFFQLFKFSKVAFVCISIKYRMAHVHGTWICGPFYSPVFIICPNSYPDCTFMRYTCGRDAPGQQDIILLHFAVKQTGIQYGILIFQIKPEAQVSQVHTARRDAVQPDMAHLRVVIVRRPYLAILFRYNKLSAYYRNHPVCSFLIPESVQPALRSP